MKIAYWITVITLSIKLMIANKELKEMEDEKTQILDKALTSLKYLQDMGLTSKPLENVTNQDLAIATVQAQVVQETHA
jgi:hypothetical protein